MIDFLKRFFSLGGPGERYFVYRVKCKRCGEVIEGRVDTLDTVLEYEDGRAVYYMHKILMGDGSNLCYQKIEVHLKFNSNRKLLEKTVMNGKFVEK